MEFFGHDIPSMKRHSHYSIISLLCLFDAFGFMEGLFSIG